MLRWPYIVYLRAPATFGMFHDDGVYLVTAKALATGQGYRIASLPGQPAQTKYPELFPWLLSLVWRAFPVFPQNLPWLRIVPFGAAIVCFFPSVAPSASPWRIVGNRGWRNCADRCVAVDRLSLDDASFRNALCGFRCRRPASDAADREATLNDATNAIAAGAIMGGGVSREDRGHCSSRRRAPGVRGKKGNGAPRSRYSVGLLTVAAPWIWWTARRMSEPIVDPFYSASNYASWNIVFNYAWAG